MYLCSLSGTWRCGLWSQCSQRQTWQRTGSSVQQQRHLGPHHCLWCGPNRTYGEEVVCTLQASGQRSDASQTSGRRAERPRRGKLQPALVSSSRLILCRVCTSNQRIMSTLNWRCSFTRCSLRVCTRNQAPGCCKTWCNNCWLNKHLHMIISTLLWHLKHKIINQFTE